MRLSDEQRMFQDAARRFAQTRLAPGAAAREMAGCIEPEVVSELAALGFMGMTVPQAWDGVAADYVSYSLALMEIAAGDGAVSTMLSVHNAPFCAILATFATEAQKNRWLRPAAAGQFIGCFALTEPEAGSDAGALRCQARKVPGGWRLSGRKQFITSARSGGATVLFAVTDPQAGKKGISAFILANDTPGLTVAEPERKAGQRASDTCAMILDEVLAPEDSLIGEPGQGLQIALSSLETGRIGIAAQAVGMAQAALDVAAAYATTRQTFGKAIFDHQAIAFRLADMDCQIEAARQLVLVAAAAKDDGQPCLREASIAKLFASEMAERAVSNAMQVLGGYGYLADFPIERIWRDVRICQIYEGTSDIQRLNISRELRRRFA